ncbi:MAG: hypothetical protein ABUS51_04420 [Acidobacteriota bacterium]
MAAFLSFALLAIIASGAALTTLRHIAARPEYIHVRAGIAVGALCFVLGVWCLLDRNPVLRWLGILVALTTGVEAMSRAVLIHACFAPVLFAAVAAVAGFRPVRPLSAPAGRFPLRPLVLCLPPLVFLQIALGAAARHKVFGVMPHLGAALPLAGLILIVCLSVLRHYSNDRPLRSRARALLVMLLIQVPLGMVVLILRSLPPNNLLAVAAAAHVATGSLTFAASALLALQYQRSVR